MNAVIKAAHIEANIGTSFHTVRSEEACLWLNVLSIFLSLVVAVRL